MAQRQKGRSGEWGKRRFLSGMVTPFCEAERVRYQLM